MRKIKSQEKWVEVRNICPFCPEINQNFFLIGKKQEYEWALNSKLIEQNHFAMVFRKFDSAKKQILTKSAELVRKYSEDKTRLAEKLQLLNFKQIVDVISIEPSNSIGPGYLLPKNGNIWTNLEFYLYNGAQKEQVIRNFLNSASRYLILQRNRPEINYYDLKKKSFFFDNKGRIFFHPFAAFPKEQIMKCSIEITKKGKEYFKAN